MPIGRRRVLTDRIGDPKHIMPRLVWLTDVHLNFASEAARSALVDEVRRARPDHLLLGGDIAEAPTLVESVQWLAAEAGCPLWFVLGNHDYYRGSIRGVREQMRQLTATADNIGWLPACAVVPLSDEAALIGHGGWGDARAGCWQTTEVVLNDYALIEELRMVACRSAENTKHTFDLREILNEELRCQLNELGNEAATHLGQAAAEALAVYRHVVVLMHVPPFLEACWHDGRITDDSWSPHFVCKAAGESLRDVMSVHPEQKMTVLCGHTHSGGECRPLENLSVLTGEARYHRPAVQRVFEV